MWQEIFEDIDNADFSEIIDLQCHTVVISYKDIPAFRDMFGSQAVERSQRLAPAYKKVAEVNGWEFLNAADYAKASEKDGIHMDAAQHKIFGAVLAQKVKEILEMLV